MYVCTTMYSIKFSFTISFINDTSLPSFPLEFINGSALFVCLFQTLQLTLNINMFSGKLRSLLPVMSFYNNIEHYLLRAQGYTAKIYLQGKFSTLIKIRVYIKTKQKST